MALSSKQQAFINEYLTDFNATRAAERAGYKGNDNTLAVTGHDLLRNPKVAEEIQKRIDERAMSADEVLIRLAEHARGDLGEYITNEGEIDIAAMKEAQASRLLRKVKFNRRIGTTKDGGTWEDITVEAELYSAQRALELIGKKHKLFTERTEVTGKDGGPIETKTTHDLSALTLEELHVLRDIVTKTTER